MVITSFQQWRDTHPFFTHFRLPQAAQESFNHLFIVLVTLTSGELWWNDSPYAATINKSIIGLYAFVIFTDLLGFASKAALAPAGHPEGEEQASSPDTMRPRLRRLAALVPAVPAALLVGWSVAYLADARIPHLNRVAFSTWAFYFVAGCLFALVRGFVLWSRAR